MRRVTLRHNNGRLGLKRKIESETMTEQSADIAIIGVGTAGMAADREAREFTDSIALIEGGPFCTTCARGSAACHQSC